MGGLDDAGKWHDPYGRFARRGMSAVKIALLRVLDGERSQHAVLSAGPDGAVLRLKPDHDLVKHLGVGPHRVHWHDARYGRIDDPRGRRVLVRWDDFDEAGLPDPPTREKAPPAPPAPSYEESRRRRERWTNVIGEMTQFGGSEDSERADRATETALAAVPDGDFARIGAALETLSDDGRAAFGVTSTEKMFPDGKLPDGVEFWFDYGVGMTAEAPPPSRIEDTTTYASYKPILDGWREHPEWLAQRGGGFDPNAPISADNEPFGNFVADAEAEMAEARQRHANIPEHRKVRTREQAQAAIGRRFVREVFAGWAESSLSYRSVIFQQAVADEFGLDYTPHADDAVKADAAAIYGAAPDGWRAYVRSLYDQTQQALADAGITEATLFRGGDYPNDAPLSSWSVSPNIATAFGSTIRRADVPAADIFATPLLTGIGKSEEAEVVVLGRNRREWTIARPGEPRDFAPDGRMFDMWFDYDQGDVQSPPPGGEAGASNDLIATEAWPSEQLVGDLSFVEDTQVPWTDRVDRLAAERAALAERLGPPRRWFHHPSPGTLTRLWGRGADGRNHITREEQQALDREQAITEFGDALRSLVAERADELSDGDTGRVYTHEASRAIIDALEAFAPASTTAEPVRAQNRDMVYETEWADDADAIAAWPTLVQGIRDGRTEVLLKPNKVVLFGTFDGHIIRASIERNDYQGDWGAARQARIETLPSGRRKYVRDTYGHIEVSTAAAGANNRWPKSGWRRGNGDFDSLRTAVKDAVDKSKKASAADLTSPPGVQAWTETMERLGIDMTTSPDVPVAGGKVGIIDKTIMPTDPRDAPYQMRDYDWAGLERGETTPFGELKPSTALAKTVAAGLAPYPRDWTEQLGPQFVHMANSTSAKVGNASNRTLDGGGNYVTVASVANNPQHAGAAAHEFGHSMQKAVEAVHLAETWHLLSRLRDHPGEQAADVSGRGRGTGFRDHFADDYSGRFYPGDATPKGASDGEMIPTVRAFEMFTTGVQGLYERRNRDLAADPELTSMVMGLMALLRPQGRPQRGIPEAGVGNDLPDLPAAPARRGSAKAHEYLDAIEAEFGDPLPAEPGYEMQTPWYASEGPSVERSYDIDRFIEMAPRYSTPDTSESDRKFVTAVKAGMIALFEDMERAGKPSPRSPEVRAALRRVADALPDGVELQTGSQFYGGGPSSIGVPVEGIEGVADALERVAPILPEVHLDTVKLTESGYGNGQAYVFPRHDASSLAMASGMYKWPRTLGASEKPWEQENYSATSHRDLTDKLITHEVGHLIQMELVRRSGVDLEPNKDRPRKVLGAMIDDAMNRLSSLADEHPALFQAATGQEPGNHSSHALTASALTNYSGQDAAEFIAEAFAMAVAGNYPDRPITRQTPIEWSARAALTNLAATTLWREAFGDLPLPGAMSRDFPDDWDDQRIAGALLGGIIPPGWTRARIEALAAAEGTPPATRAALEALAAKMEPS